jgi:hypothetical protein
LVCTKWPTLNGMLPAYSFIPESLKLGTSLLVT